MTALDQTWHPEHFVCASCGCPFGDTGFHERDGKPFCREDYYAMFAPRCGGCGQPIMDSYISALSAHWHSECFVCSVSSLLFLASLFAIHFLYYPFCKFGVIHGCHRSGNGQEKNFFKVREKSGNFILSQGKLTF